MGDRVLYSLIGSVVGLTIPFDWLLWRAFSARKDWWMSWLKTEFTRHGSTYILMAVLAVAVFAALGYFLGQQRDEMTEESEQARSNNAELSALANTDGLTGLLNARAVHEQLEFEMENSYRTPLTILLLDIDHFKKINDTYGHPFGDDVLAGVARLVRGNVRRSDPVEMKREVAQRSATSPRAIKTIFGTSASNRRSFGTNSKPISRPARMCASIPCWIGRSFIFGSTSNGKTFQPFRFITIRVPASVTAALVARRARLRSKARPRTSMTLLRNSRAEN